MRTPDRPPRPPHEERDGPPVMLPAKEAGGWGGKRPWLVALGGLAIGAVVAVSIASTGRSDASVGRPMAGAPGEPARPSGEAALVGAIGSLRTSLDGYDQRQADFERGRIECAALTAGYDRVSREVVDVARRRRAVRDPGPETISAFDSVMEEAASIDRRFDETGCPRP